MSKQKLLKLNPQMSNTEQDWNYETAVAEVEEIMAQIESGSLPLENVFEQFAIATKLLRQCETFLTQGKQRMNLLIETLEPESDF